MARALIIVESPAKAKTIARFLGDEFTVATGTLEASVMSSVGHIRDLPQRASDVPEAYKGESWARLGVDVDNGFKPLYVVNPGKKDVVRDLKRELKDSDELFLATDEDREGEAIAWHLLEVLNPPASMPVKRMVFHEITPAAIEEAIANPRELNRRLVDAQETRRILDRLYGFEVSPVLWRKVSQGLSAGRVQSVATRLVVERERERMRFVAANYWDLDGEFSVAAESDRFNASLVQLDGTRLATGKDFDLEGRVTRDDVVVLDGAGATTLARELTDAPFAVRSVERKPYRRRPAAPFITSTFQQEAGRKLRISSKQAMAFAQSLYENGYITYMRTDSTTLSSTALDASRREIATRYGNDYLPDAPRQYAKKVKNAQEAHEAIRPAGETFRSPDDVAREVNQGEARVYDLIWKRTVASQMTDATGETVSVRLGATSSGGRDAEFATSGTVITHQGFLLAYVEDADEGDATNADDRERRLPAMAEGNALDAHSIEPKGHETSPPPRYTEASLVKKLEELGVGRPSTYASIMGTIEARGYVWKKSSALVPSFTAFAVVSLLEQHFPSLVDYAFTARMEDDLDDIANGDGEMVPWLTEFYFGPDGSGPGDGPGGGLKELVSDRLDEIDARAVNSIPIGVDENGQLIEARVGRYGPYLERGEERASIPEDLAPDELTVDRAVELIEAPKGDRVVGNDPESGKPVYVKAGRFGPYVQLGELEDGADKPKTASLFQTMSVETIELDEALRLLSMPRVVGNDPESGEEILSLNGRYGPYLKKGTDTRSLEAEEQIFTVTVDDAVKLFAEPKRRRGQARQTQLRELGEDPATGKPMVIKDGRFGPYVTDGETNASLRKGDEVETITDERAAELLQDRRDRGPVKKRASKKKAAAKKKASAKKRATKTKGGAKKQASPPDP
jgi:DNA topoisomerase-1